MQENFSLQSYNTFGVDANTQYFTEVKSIEELKDALTFSKDQCLPILFLGGGSNIL